MADDHGWQQKVANVKKQRRPESATKVREKPSSTKSSSAEAKLFQALQEESVDRRSRREARIQAWLAGDAQSEEESDAENNNERQPVDAEVKKSKVKKATKPKVTVAEAAAAIDLTDLLTFLSDISDSVSAAADVQLLRCADYFARAFSGVTTATFAWNKILRETPLAKQMEIPLCFVPEAVNKMLADWLAQRPAEALSKFIVWILKEVVDDAQAHSGAHKSSEASVSSQKTKVGILILLAIIARRKPDILHHQAATVRNQFQGPDQLPTLVWVYGQAAQGDLVVGMHMCVQNLLLLAVGKSSTPALRDTTLQFIESVLFANLKKARPILQNGVSRKGERVVPAASLDSVMKAAFPAESARPKKNRKHQQEPRELLASNDLTGKEIVLRDVQNQSQSLDQEDNKALIEGVAAMLPPQQDGVSCSFLLRLLRAACVFGASTACREELESRVGSQLEHASLSDLLIPSSSSSSPTMYDLDVVQRILEQFLLKEQSGVASPTTTLKSDKHLHVFENGISKPPTTPNMAKSKVAKLMDAYLAEVARDPNLPLARFQNLAESLPQFSRATDDGLYRAVDTYLKAHPSMTEHERKKLCRVMDCQRLSLEACLHAAQNERLPLRVVVQVLFSEQVKLRNAVSGNSSKKTRDHDGSSVYPSTRDHSQGGGQGIASRHDESEADGLSLHESWLAAREDIKFLKQDMERMKAKYADLEQESLSQQVEKKAKPKAHYSSGWTSGWRKLSNTLKPHKDDSASMAPTHASAGDATRGSHSNNFTTPRAPSEQRRRSHSVTSTFTMQRWRNSIS